MDYSAIDHTCYNLSKLINDKSVLTSVVAFKRTVDPSDFENKRFPLNACILSRLFQKGKVETKAETIE